MFTQAVITRTHIGPRARARRRDRGLFVNPPRPPRETPAPTAPADP